MQKKSKAVLIALFLALSCTITAFAVDNGPMYIVKGEYSNDNIYSVDIAIDKVNALAGTFTLDYDQSKLQILNGDTSIQNAVKAGRGVTISAEGMSIAELISIDDGYVHFAWYPSSSRLDSRNEPKTVGTIEFALKEGITTADFDSETFRMQYLEDDSILGDTGAAICEEGLVYYKSNVDNSNPINIVFNYAGSGAAPSDAQNVTMQICDSANLPIGGAKAIVGSKSFVADSNGNITLAYSAGNYRYTISADNYETKYGTLNIESGEDTAKIILRSKNQLVQDVAQKLEIGFTQGDSANSVTRGLLLATKGENNTKITWTSSNTAVITDIGSVFPAKAAAHVTLKATVSKDGLSASKSFEVRVLAKSELPDGGTPEKPSVGGFADISSVPWAQEAINKLAEIGVINGISETEFLPGGNIRRGDFIAMLMRMIKPQGNATSQFTDVPSGSYYYNEIALAKATGIANGYQDGSFHPDESISRQDMMVITHRALVKTGNLSSADSTNMLGQFKDGTSVAEYAVSAVNSVVSAGLISGDNAQNLNPTGHTTRAETAVFLYRVYSKFSE